MRMHHKVPLAAALCALVSACADGEGPHPEEIATDQSELIIDDEDWDDVANHVNDAAYGLGYHHSKGVGNIGNCTAFLVARMGRAATVNGVNTFATIQWSQWWMTPDTHVLAGDFDNNGRADIMKFDNGSPGGVWVGLSFPWGLSTTKWGDWWMDPSIHVLAGDFNIDGKTDVMKLDNGSPAGVWVGLSNGSAFNTSKWADWWMSPSTQVLAGRFAGVDFRDDILKIDNQWQGNALRLWIGQSNGVNTFAGIMGETRWIQPQIKLLAADVNGDLRTDVVLFGNGQPGTVTVRLTP